MKRHFWKFALLLVVQQAVSAKYWGFSAMLRTSMNLRIFWAIISMLCLAHCGNIQAGEIHETREVHTCVLGRGYGNPLTVKVIYEGNPQTAGLFSVAFFAGRGQQKRRIAFQEIDMGVLSGAKKTKFTCADFLHLGRRQVFISAELGSVTTRLFDFDGRKVRTLYANTGGRVWVSLTKARGKHFRIVEDWPDRQFKYSKNMGLGKLIGVNVIRRRMLWNRLRFIPEVPGPTRIVGIKD